jgi:hypothetical protein
MTHLYPEFLDFYIVRCSNRQSVSETESVSILRRVHVSYSAGRTLWPLVHMRPRGPHLSAKLVSNFMGRGCRVVSSAGTDGC